MRYDDLRYQEIWTPSLPNRNKLKRLAKLFASQHIDFVSALQRKENLLTKKKNKKKKNETNNDLFKKVKEGRKLKPANYIQF